VLWFRVNSLEIVDSNTPGNPTIVLLFILISQSCIFVLGLTVYTASRAFSSLVGLEKPVTTSADLPQNTLCKGQFMADEKTGKWWSGKRSTSDGRTGVADKFALFAFITS